MIMLANGGGLVAAGDLKLVAAGEISTGICK